MFNIFKRRKKTSSSGGVDNSFPLKFKDAVSALEYACKYLECPLTEGAFLPALVLDARETYGTDCAVKIQDDGCQLAVLRVASDDGGFVVPATTASSEGPRLRPGQLVAWKAMKYMPEVGAKTDEERLGWVGLIIATLRPEYQDGSWIGDERY